MLKHEDREMLARVGPGTHWGWVLGRRRAAKKTLSTLDVGSAQPTATRRRQAPVSPLGPGPAWRALRFTGLGASAQHCANFVCATLAQRAGRSVCWLCLVLVAAGCAPTRSAGLTPAEPGGAAVQTGQGPQRTLRLVTRDEPTMFSAKLDRDGMGAPASVGLTFRDDRDVIRPMLAERVPSQDDGSWTINPDGTMKTVYPLKKGLKWQDGEPLLAGDFVFAQRVYTDRDVPVTSRTPESLMSQVLARDDSTIEITWRELYIWANSLGGDPLPRHLLESLYTTDKPGFVNSSFWTSEEFVGNGPYRVAEWQRGVAIVMSANPHFVMGKPKIETVEYRFVTDPNTTVANFLAGITDFGQYTAINTEQARVLVERWQSEGGGRIYADSLWGVRYMEFQHRDVPNHQKAVTDVRVRRALTHAMDREALADALQQGFATAAETGVPKSATIYPRVDQVISKYPYDPRRTEALLGDVGWTKGGDGMFRNAAGQTLDIEIRVTSERQQEQAIIADDWKRAGINSSLSVVPRGLTSDGEFRASFPAVEVSSHSHNRDVVTAVNVTSEAAARPENRFTAKNRGNYSNPEIDRLYAEYLRTIAPVQRDNVLLELERVFTSDVAQATLYYIPQVAAVRAGVKGIRPPVRGSLAWNLWEWSFE